MKDDDFAKLMGVGQLDQMLTGIRQMASVMTTYFKALMEQGMDREEALTMAVAYQQALLSHGRNQAGSDG